MAASLNSNANADSSLHSTCDSAFDADCNTDPFATENNGTARYMGNTVGGIGGGFENISGLNNSSGTSGLGVGNNINELGAPFQIGCGSGSGKFEFHTMKANMNLKPTRTELPRSELLKMLFYLEGELQARDVVIAALRNERVKQYITQLRNNPISPSDPYAAIFRDKIALAGNLISRQSSTTAVQAEMEVRLIIEQQMESLYQMVHKQRATHVRMVGILTESLGNNQRMLQELEEEKRKHEHDTAQGDDITYGLEMERTKLRQELETERQQVKKFEKDLKKLQETLDFERGRQKQIVLLLIAERKKILMKYIEEGKRSEDLAQILSEEKLRSDSIAEGLEEESKKSLRMEAEIEKQAFSFDGERKTMKMALAKDEKRIKELEAQLAQLKNENEVLRMHHQQAQLQQNSAIPSSVPLRLQQTSHTVSIPNLPTKSRSLNDETCGSLMVNIAKIVQPTATVSSVPVSGPTTGIARSISPGQSLRSSTANQNVVLGCNLMNEIQINNGNNFNTFPATSSTANSNASSTVAAASSLVPSTLVQLTSSLSAVSSNAPPAKIMQPQTVHQLSSSPSGSTLSCSGVPPSASSINLSTMQRVSHASGVVGKYAGSLSCISPAISTALATTLQNSLVTPPQNASINSLSGQIGCSTTMNATAVGQATLQPVRGVPPPIPPNKPVVPPKREPSLSRLPSQTSVAIASCTTVTTILTSHSISSPAAMIANAGTAVINTVSASIHNK